MKKYQALVIMAVAIVAAGTTGCSNSNVPDNKSLSKAWKPTPPPAGYRSDTSKVAPPPQSFVAHEEKLGVVVAGAKTGPGVPPGATAPNAR